MNDLCKTRQALRTEQKRIGWIAIYVLALGWCFLGIALVKLIPIPIIG